MFVCVGRYHALLCYDSPLAQGYAGLGPRNPSQTSQNINYEESRAPAHHSQTAKNNNYDESRTPADHANAHGGKPGRGVAMVPTGHTTDSNDVIEARMRVSLFVTNSCKVLAVIRAVCVARFPHDLCVRVMWSCGPCGHVHVHAHSYVYETSTASHAEYYTNYRIVFI